MNKKLIAAALTAALAAPMAAAHADMTVYGKADVSLDSIDTGGTDSGSTKAKSLYGSSNSSRIGVKGSEDLGGGLKAIYTMEWGVGMFNGTDLNTRNRMAGLAGSFGKVELGYQDTPMKRLWTSYDINLEHVGDLGNVSTDNNRYDGIQYTSPKLGGSWTIQGAYTPDNGAADTSGASLAVNGMAGPVKLGIGTETYKMGTGNKDQKTNRVAASMTFGMLMVNAWYSKTTDVGGTANKDLETTALQAKFNMGSGNDLRLGLAQAKYKNDSDNKATMTTIGFDHHLSKKTFMYVDYATTSNKVNGTFGVTGGAHGGAAAKTVSADNDPKAISIGMVVAF